MDLIGAGAADLPCPDFRLLRIVKRSPQYLTIRARVREPKPVEAWRDGPLNWFFFELACVGAGSCHAMFVVDEMTLALDHAVEIQIDADGRTERFVPI